MATSKIKRRRWLNLMAATPLTMHLSMQGAGAAAPTGEGESDTEFNGPFPDWLHADDPAYGADPTGAASTSDQLQAMLNDLALDNRQIGDPATDPRYQVYQPQVGYLPPGTYLIDKTILLPDSAVSADANFESKSLVACPGTVVFKWVGEAGGTMLWMNGCNGSLLAGITFDLNHRARIGVRLERDTRLHLTSQSYNRIEECQFVNPVPGASYAFFNTQSTDRATANQGTDSEVEFIRCRVIGAFNRGVCNTGIEAFDYWVRQCYFEGCSVAVSNGDSGTSEQYPFDGSNLLINTIGKFHTYDNFFNTSTFLDIQEWGNQHPSGHGRNFSINSQRFLAARDAYVTVFSNVVIDPVQPDAIRFYTPERGDVDPTAAAESAPIGRQRSILYANQVRSRSGAAGPIISEIYDRAVDARHLAIGRLDIGSLQIWTEQKPLFFAQGNSFSVNYDGAIGTDPTYDNTALLDTRLKRSIDGTVPLKAPFARQVTRRVFVIGRNGEPPQATVDAAAAYAKANPGSCPVVYHPAFVFGQYAQLAAPLTFPANVKMSLQGCGHASMFTWRGDPHASTVPYIVLRGPSKVTIKHHHGGQRGSGNGGGKDGRVVLIDNCDQVGARLYHENGSGWFSTVGTANLKAELVDHLFDSNTDDNLPCRTVGHAARMGAGYTLVEGGTAGNDLSTALFSVQSGGRLILRSIWFESNVPNQMNFDVRGNGPRPALLSMEASRFIPRNQSWTPGGENWRFTQLTATDLNGQLIFIGSDFLGETHLAGDASRVDFLNIGGTTLIKQGDPAPRTMYRNHGPLSRLESPQTFDMTPVGATGALPATYASTLANLAVIKPTVFIRDLAAGVTDVRFYRVNTDVECIADVYV